MSYLVSKGISQYLCVILQAQSGSSVPRTFHLVADTNLVLAVSMPNVMNGYPRMQLEMQGCAVILQVKLLV